MIGSGAALYGFCRKQHAAPSTSVASPAYRFAGRAPDTQPPPRSEESTIALTKGARHRARHTSLFPSHYRQES